MDDKKPQWFMEHEKSDEENFGVIRQTLIDIKENHLAHIQIAQETQAVEMSWIKWLVVGIAGGVGAVALAVIIKLV